MLQEAMKTGTAASSTRQTFSGRDDLILLGLVESVTPWSHRGGVMDAWNQIAQAMNADTTSTLSGLTAATTRARFFRMVSQRRDRQDKMLRRGTASELEFQAKLKKLDGVIAQLNAYEQDGSLTATINEVQDESDGSQVALQLSSQVSTIIPTRRAQAPAATPLLSVKKPKTAANPALATNSSLPIRPLLPTTITRSPLPPSPAIVELKKSSNNHEPPSAKPIQAQTTVGDRFGAHFGSAQEVPSGANDATNLGWLKVADRALSLINSKFELDRETAIADRAQRQEDARIRAQEISNAREQNRQLIEAVLSMARAASKH